MKFSNLALFALLIGFILMAGCTQSNGVEPKKTQTTDTKVVEQPIVNPNVKPTVTPSCSNGMVKCAAGQFCKNNQCVEDTQTCTPSSNGVRLQKLSGESQSMSNHCSGNKAVTYACNSQENGIVTAEGECAEGFVCQNAECVKATCGNSGITCGASSFCLDGQCTSPSCQEFENGYKIIETSSQGLKTYYDTCTGNHGSVLVDYSCIGSKAIPKNSDAGNGRYCVVGKWVKDVGTCTELANGISITNQSWGRIDYLNTCSGTKIITTTPQADANWPNGYFKEARYSCKNGMLTIIAAKDCLKEGKAVCRDGVCLSK